MSVQTLLATTSSIELAEWQAFFKVKEEREKEREQRRQMQDGAVKGAAEMTQQLRAKR